MLSGTSFLLLHAAMYKCFWQTICVISSEPACKNYYMRFTMVPLKALSIYIGILKGFVWWKYKLDINVHNFENWLFSWKNRKFLSELNIFKSRKMRIIDEIRFQEYCWNLCIVIFAYRVAWSYSHGSFTRVFASYLL